MFRTIRLHLVLPVVLALAFAACGGSGDASPASIPEPGPGEGDQVLIKTFIFRPDPMTVSVGTTVTFTNLDDILHTVTAGERGAPTGAFDGQLDGIDSTFTFTFDEPGTYAYHCSIHPGMDAEIVVR